jgi:hypothetical protein
MLSSFSNPLVRHKENSFSVQIYCRVRTKYGVVLRMKARHQARVRVARWGSFPGLKNH